ncbi:MAG: tetratricopeptide repeat protein [Halofilum sp. (in: g-proteobacteria)]|nr:tetratricopeptide repeat protein [Halofilum sp. (in: g-proteobacteria)]
MVDERLYRSLKITALVMALGWVAWTFYDGFVRERSAEVITLEAAHKAFADGLYEKARSGYREILDAPGAGRTMRLDARRGLARTLMELGEHEAALRQFDRAIDAAPEFGAAYANRGILYDRMGRYERAMADYRKALELDPSLDEGPGFLTRFMRNQAEQSPTIGDRADYLAAQLAKPPGQRLLRVPEKDAEQQSYRKDEYVETGE